MANLMHRATLAILRSAMWASRDLTIEYHGEILTVEPHALLHASRSSAFVLAAWVPAQTKWGFFRFAEIRGVTFEKRVFIPRPGVPRTVPYGSAVGH